VFNLEVRNMSGHHPGAYKTMSSSGFLSKKQQTRTPGACARLSKMDPFLPLRSKRRR